MEHRDALTTHLAWWGLRRFTSEAAYDQWQRDTLSPEHVAELNRLVELKRAQHALSDEVAFYDVSAHPEILPVLYSQRYDYYVAVGPALAELIARSRTVLDFGCGPGILTTFYASQFPDRTFVGIDRSQACIDIAAKQASTLGLANVRFVCHDLRARTWSGQFDLVIASQALFQSEADPGVPSSSWDTFDRPHDPGIQAAFERRTGLTVSLDHLCALLGPASRLILFEKTHHLARRVPFQRALASRGLTLLAPPQPMQYLAVEEPVEDGPLYVLKLASHESFGSQGPAWSESPAITPEQELYACRGEAARMVCERLPQKSVTAVVEWPDATLGKIRVEWGRAAHSLRYLYVDMGANTLSSVILVAGALGAPILMSYVERIRHLKGRDSRELLSFLESICPSLTGQTDSLETPLYENHTPAAQGIWADLASRRVDRECTDEELGGRQLHIEMGTAAGLVFLYCANTLDQRQLILMDVHRRKLLEDYYQELLQDHHTRTA
ncbi:MAG: methyltransferase domain-containing protein [Nitrospirales bacterium]